MSTSFVYYAKEDPWQDHRDGNHGLPVLLARRSDVPGSEACWNRIRGAWEPFPDLFERLMGVIGGTGSRRSMPASTAMPRLLPADGLRSHCPRRSGSA